MVGEALRDQMYDLAISLDFTNHAEQARVQ